MCTFVYCSFTSVLCLSGGLVSLDLRGWRGLTCPRHPPPAGTLPPAAKTKGREGPPHTPPTFTTSTQIPSAACWQTHAHSRCQNMDPGTVTSYLASLSSGKRCAQAAPTLENHLHLFLSYNWWLYWLVCETCLHCHHFWIQESVIHRTGIQRRTARVVQHIWKTEDMKLCICSWFFIITIL